MHKSCEMLSWKGHSSFWHYCFFSVSVLQSLMLGSKMLVASYGNKIWNQRSFPYLSLWMWESILRIQSALDLCRLFYRLSIYLFWQVRHQNNFKLIILYFGQLEPVVNFLSSWHYFLMNQAGLLTFKSVKNVTVCHCCSLEGLTRAPSLLKS